MTLHLGLVSPDHAPLTTSRGVHRGRPTLLLGVDGLPFDRTREFWAEACPLPGFGAAGDDLDLAQSELSLLEEAAVLDWFDQPSLGALDRVFEGTAGLRSAAARHAIEWLAIEVLAHEAACGAAELVLAWLRKKSSPALWPGLRQVLAGSAVLDLLDPELSQKATRHFEDGVHTWKLKCGRDGEGEQRGLRVLAELGFPARLRLDPGAAWTLPQALELVRETLSACERSSLVLEYVEDPTRDPEEWGALAELCPLAADEVLASDGSRPELLHASTWILKPMALGIGRLLELALTGKRLGRQLVLSHTFDGPLALRAAFELACVIQTQELGAGLGGHPALAAWQTLDAAKGTLVRGSRAGPDHLHSGVLLDGGRLGRSLVARGREPGGSAVVDVPVGDALGLARASACYGDRPFLAFADETLTFREVAERVAASPPSQGGAFLPLLAEPTRTATLELLAALERGPPPLLLDPRAPSAVQQALIERCRRHGAELRPDDALIVPTSGSTGEPHLVVHTRGSLLASVSASAARLGGPTSSSRWLLSLPFAHVGGLSIVLRCLAAGACIVVEPLPKVPAAAARFLAEREVTHLSLVPTQLLRLLQDPSFVFPPTVECVLLGGAETPPALRHRALERGAPIYCTYGLTEMGSQVATKDLRSQRARNSAGHGAGNDAAGTTVGRALPGAQLALSADGCLRVGGPMLMRRYLGEQAPLADFLLATGDLGELTPSGELTVLGRIDDLIITGGENVAPALVERALVTAPGVREVCAVGLKNDEWGQAIVAAVVPDEQDADQTLLLRELAAAARSLLPAFARPKAYRFFAELPTLGAGKIDRRALAVLLADEGEFRTG